MSRAQADKQVQAMEKLREEAVEAKMQALKVETERRVREEMAPQAVSDDQLSALQARLAAFHEARLLTGDEIFRLEGLCADFADGTSGRDDERDGVLLPSI